MGSRGNTHMVNGLVRDRHIHSAKVERAFRLVDRGIFLHPYGNPDRMYVDGPFRTTDRENGQIHLSATSIYTAVMEILDIEKGHSFLNIGSGTGYLSTIAGFFMGVNGQNHGIELYPSVVDHANNAVEEFSKQRFVPGFDWCKPRFVHGNALYLKNISKRYDRIYIGSKVEEENLPLFAEMLKIGGMLITPKGGHMICVKRTEDTFATVPFMHVAFVEMVPIRPAAGENESGDAKRRRLESGMGKEEGRMAEETSARLISLFGPRNLDELAVQFIGRRIMDKIRFEYPMAIMQQLAEGENAEHALKYYTTRFRRLEGPVEHQGALHFFQILAGPLADARRAIPAPENLERRVQVAEAGLMEQLVAQTMHQVEGRDGLEGMVHLVQAQAVQELGVAQRRLAREGLHRPQLHRFPRLDAILFTEEEHRQRRAALARDLPRQLPWEQYNLRMALGNEREEMRRDRANEVRTLYQLGLKACSIFPVFKARDICGRGWTGNVRRLMNAQRTPETIFDNMPRIFEKECVPLPSGRLYIEDWYLKERKNEFEQAMNDMLNRINVVGRAQQRQEMNEYEIHLTPEEFEMALKLNKREEKASISRFESHAVLTVDQLPLSHAGKAVLRYHLFRIDY